MSAYRAVVFDFFGTLTRSVQRGPQHADTARRLGTQQAQDVLTERSQLVDALPVLLAPLRLLRLPVDEWVTVCALALRMLPTIRGEMRMLFAARRLRGRPGIRNPRGWWPELIDTVGAVASVSMRQVRDLGDALSVRGPRPVVRTRPRLGAGDAVTVLIVGAACAAIVVWG